MDIKMSTPIKQSQTLAQRASNNGYQPGTPLF